MKRLSNIVFSKLFIVFVLTFALSACQQTVAHSELAAKEITSALVGGLGIENMTELNNDQIVLRYPVDMSFLEDQSVYISTANNNADEVAVFKLKNLSVDDVANFNTVTGAISERIEQKLRSFESLNPVEFEKVGRAEIRCHSHEESTYIVLVICENSDSTYEILLDLTDNGDWVDLK